MIVLAPSVPHTGAGFVSRELLRHFTKIGMAAHYEHDHGQISTHLDGYAIDQVANLMVLRNYPTIVPLRHPELVAISWKRRGEEVSDAIPYWQALIEVIDPLEPCYLRLDSEYRDADLDVINGRWGLNLETDWPIVNASTDAAKPLDHRERDTVGSLMSEYRAFFARFSYAHDR